MGVVINGEYYENLVFSEDETKNNIMFQAFIREYELRPEYDDLYAKYANWVVDSCCPDYDGDVTQEEANSWANRMTEIEDELASFFEGTNITWEEYEEAKNNLH